MGIKEEVEGGSEVANIRGAVSWGGRGWSGSDNLVTPPATPSERMIWVPGVMGVPGGGPPV